MQVVFRRTGPRRYAVRAERDGHPTLHMDPAPGFDEHVPHDLFHFVVEQELRVRLGVFGQLASGGDAATFYLTPPGNASKEHGRDRRRIKARGRRLARAGRADADFSERAVGLCEIEWAARLRRTKDAPHPIARATRQARDGYAEADRERLSDEAIDRICRRLREVADRWSGLEAGEEIVLTWE